MIVNVIIGENKNVALTCQLSLPASRSAPPPSPPLLSTPSPEVALQGIIYCTTLVGSIQFFKGTKLPSTVMVQVYKSEKCQHTFAEDGDLISCLDSDTMSDSFTQRCLCFLCLLSNNIVNNQ